MSISLCLATRGWLGSGLGMATRGHECSLVFDVITLYEQDWIGFVDIAPFKGFAEETASEQKVLVMDAWGEAEPDAHNVSVEVSGENKVDVSGAYGTAVTGCRFTIVTVTNDGGDV